MESSTTMTMDKSCVTKPCSLCLAPSEYSFKKISWIERSMTNGRLPYHEEVQAAHVKRKVTNTIPRKTKLLQPLKFRCQIHMWRIHSGHLVYGLIWTIHPSHLQIFGPHVWDIIHCEAEIAISVVYRLNSWPKNVKYNWFLFYAPTISDSLLWNNRLTKRFN